MSNRLTELKENYEAIQERINKACQKAGRQASEITLIAVTKTYPAIDVDLLQQLGIVNVGENKDQEASAKKLEVKEQFKWHFIGQLQSNKAKSVVNYADLIHSVDRISLVKELQKSFTNITFANVRREQNKIADGLVNKALDEKVGGK
ncbi:MAG: reverse transcriptase-like protein [Candidatus Nanopelagicales bacterium]|nr:reverse transcriptase-like protein [Candidatus Nanopelagicales bacterium]